MNDKNKTKEQLIKELTAMRRKLAAPKAANVEHDALTGLPNNLLLYDRLAQELLQASRKKTNVAVLFLIQKDIKLINDNYGHTTGNKLIQATAERLRECLRKNDTLARPGRNEFIILLSDIRKAEDTIAVADKIIHLFDSPFQLDGHEIFIEHRIGISLFPGDGSDADSLLKNAYAAMHHAREKDSYYMFFSEAMNSKALQLFTMANDLRSALKKNEFILHYQPQVDLKSGRITGMEALLRWQRPGVGMVSPAEFIPTAETTGLIVPIGDWVMESACAQQKKWQEAGIAPALIAVNVSAKQFRQKNMMQKLLDVIHKTGLELNVLELELTESVIFEDDGITMEMLIALKKLGVDISIDDFGTGYSSMSMLKKFQANKLKIDRSFVRSISVNPVDAAIAKLIIDFSRVLAINVIAEGIETVEQLEFLRSAGCNGVQGYLLSRPVAAPEATLLLKERTLSVATRREASP